MPLLGTLAAALVALDAGFAGAGGGRCLFADLVYRRRRRDLPEERACPGIGRSAEGIDEGLLRERIQLLGAEV